MAEEKGSEMLGFGEFEVNESSFRGKRYSQAATWACRKLVFEFKQFRINLSKLFGDKQSISVELISFETKPNVT